MAKQENAKGEAPIVTIEQQSVPSENTSHPVGFVHGAKQTYSVESGLDRNGNPIKHTRIDH